MKKNSLGTKIVMLTSFAVVALLSTGCVSKGTHESTLAELDKTQSSLTTAQERIYNKNQSILSQQLEIKKNNEEISKSKRELAELENNKLALQQELADSQTLLNASKRKIETMRQIEAETKKRNEIYARFVSKLQKMIDGGQLTVSIEKGRIVINLPDNVLFATGHAKVNAEGQKALKQIATVLKEFSDRSFQVEGHTDNVPIKSARYPSNWELSSARALSVVHLMTEEGVESKNISAAGFGEFHPRADNETKDGRTLNRRIEIIMLPNLDILSNELPKVIK
ncbi:MAG: OmpA family protein [Sulfurimonas sp.]|jgi:chemotaxis protein MotB|nr:OmpA family protein [Sulfurimonas sp.]